MKSILALASCLVSIVSAAPPLIVPGHAGDLHGLGTATSNLRDVQDPLSGFALW